MSLSQVREKLKLQIDLLLKMQFTDFIYDRFYSVDSYFSTLLSCMLLSHPNVMVEILNVQPLNGGCRSQEAALPPC